MEKNIIFSLSLLAAIINIALFLILELQLFSSLKTKNQLSMHTNSLMIFENSWKPALFTVYAIIPDEVENKIWVLLVLSTIPEIAKMYIALQQQPYYNMYYGLAECIISAVILSLNLLHFIIYVIKLIIMTEEQQQQQATHARRDLDSLVIISWFLLLPLVIKIAINKFDKRILKSIFVHFKKATEVQLLHRPEIYKYLSKRSRLSEESSLRFAATDLLIAGINAQI